MSWKERIEKIRKELGIRDSEWYEIVDKLTIMDELNILLIYEIRKLRDEIREAIGLPPAPVPVPAPPPPPAPPVPAPKLPKIIRVIDAALVPIEYTRIDVTTEKDATHELKDETEVIMIVIRGTDVRVSLVGPTSDSTPPFTDGSILLFTRHKLLRKIWFRAVTSSGEVYVCEYGTEK